ncbi:MAG: FixH family protein [Pseudorhodoplanes sp.]|nr:FixH family protein [Pseudorhodoplanes sp.]
MALEQSPRREITGRFVLLTFCGFFGVVFAMNALMLYAATSTFGGVETQSSYKAGLAFKNEIAAARSQDALHWSVAGTISRDPAGRAIVDLSIRDARGLQPGNIALEVRLAHPTDARLDRPVPVARKGSQGFSGEVFAGPGQWVLAVDVMRDGERLFRSRNRVILK